MAHNGVSNWSPEDSGTAMNCIFPNTAHCSAKLPRDPFEEPLEAKILVGELLDVVSSPHRESSGISELLVFRGVSNFT